MKNRQVLAFWIDLESNLNNLHNDLMTGAYKHGSYTHFVICDPKRRDIYVPQVKDRIAHQWLVTYLEPVIQKRFYRHSYSAQQGKGVHSMRDYLFTIMQLMRGSRSSWIGKLDIAKYYQSIDHEILKTILIRHCTNQQILKVLFEIIDSFGQGTGIPLGNITSQWLGNIYLNELDHYVKHTLQIKCYARYNDDLIIIGRHEYEVRQWMEHMIAFVNHNLKLTVPLHKQSLQQLPSAIDVLGYVSDGYRMRLRNKTKKRMQKNIDETVRDLEERYWDVVGSGR